MKKDKVYGPVRIDEKLLENIEVWRKVNNISKSEVLRLGLKVVARQPTVEDVIQKIKRGKE